MYGIDVSNWQSGLQPSSMPIDFCIIKATEGLGYTDPECDTFVQDCIDNNILWGFYHFARENDPIAEAEYFVQETSNYFNHGIPVLDYETNNDNDVSWCETFLAHVHDLMGVWPIIYLSAYRIPNYSNSWIPSKCGLWVAGYPYPIASLEAPDMPYDISPWEFAAIWQFTSQAIVPGWFSKLDGDIAYMNANAWYKYANADDAPYIPPTPVKTTDDLVREVMLGEYGTGEDRKHLLGSRYDEVQNRINELYRIANEAIRGNWGNGWNREQALTGAGYPYDLVQDIVNSILEEGC